MVRFLTITRGKNFVLTHPPGEERYSYEVSLIDNKGKNLNEKMWSQPMNKVFIRKFREIDEICVILHHQVKKKIIHLVIYDTTR